MNIQTTSSSYRLLFTLILSVSRAYDFKFLNQYWQQTKLVVNQTPANERAAGGEFKHVRECKSSFSAKTHT